MVPTQGPGAATPDTLPPSEAAPAMSASDRSTPQAPPASTAEPPRPAAETPSRPRLLVLDLIDKGAGPDVTAVINAAVQAQAVESFVLGEAVTATQLRVALDASATQLMLGCDVEECMVDVAKTVNATVALGGSVTKAGDDVVITVTTVRTSDGSRTGQQQRMVPVNRDLTYYAAKQLASLVLTGKTVDPTVPVLVNVDQNDATIIVDGKEVGVGDDATVRLSPGEHEVRVRKNGFVEWTGRVTVVEATPLSITARLVRDRVELWPVSVGAGALTVVLGGVSVGTWIAAQQLYDGSFGGDPATSYLGQSPTTSEQLKSKADLITVLSGGRAARGETGTPGIATIAAALAGVTGIATVALVTTDIILGASGAE